MHFTRRIWTPPSGLTLPTTAATACVRQQQLLLTARNGSSARSINPVETTATATAASSPTTLSAPSPPKPHASAPVPVPTEPLECHEIELPMPWGPIAAKWWGPRSGRPILAIHGWQDNAGTFDRLIPLLPRHVGYLAIDLPGHGRSAHFPTGMTYSTLDFLHCIELIRTQLRWERVSLLAHSMGSQMSFLYAAVFPERPDMLVGIDVLKPLQRRNPRVLADIALQVDTLVTDAQRKRSASAPPAYTYADLVERLVKGTNNSVTADCAPHLLDRSVLPSAADASKFYFARDGRLKALNYMVSHHQLTLEMARVIRVPHLFFKASRAPYYEDQELFDETVAVLQQTNPLFRLVRVEGTHHVHLTDPQAIAGEVAAWVRKYRPESGGGGAERKAEAE